MDTPKTQQPHKDPKQVVAAAKKGAEDIIKAARKYTDKKTVLAALSFILVLAIAMLSSVPEFMIDPTQIFTAKFITKLIMTLVIGITSLVAFILIGGTSNANNPASDIYTARESFRNSAKKIITSFYSAFKQWIEKVRRPAKQLEVNLRVLRHAGITNLKYLELDEVQLRDLINAPDKELGEQFGVRQITQEQYDVIMAIKTGKTAMRFLSVDDYLLEKTIGIEQTDEETLVNQFKKRNFMFGERVGSRMLIIIVLAVTFGSIGWSTAAAIGEDMTVAQRTFTVIWDALSKLCTAVSSAFIGFFDGGKFNDFDATYLQIKCNVHSQFLEDKEFKPLSDKELAKEEYLEYHQKQEEENRKQLGMNAHLLEHKEELDN